MNFLLWLKNAWVASKLTDWVIAGMAIASVIVASLQYSTTRSELIELKQTIAQTDRALCYAQDSSRGR